MSFARVALLSLAVSGGAWAQAEVLFTHRPVQFHEAEVDRRFERTRFGLALERGNDSPGCIELLGGMFTLLGEVGPRLHQRDENFFLEPGLVQALTGQLSVPGFPATKYFAEMVRRVMIDGKLPPEWLPVIQQVNARFQLIDLTKIHYLADGPRLISSFYLTLPLLRDRHHVEVDQANSTVAGTAQRAFRDAYLDHDVAWGGLTLRDIKVVRLKHHERETLALLDLLPPPRNPLAQLTGMGDSAPEPPVIHVWGHLLPKQYLALAKVPRGSRLLVRGRLYDFNRDLTQIELRDALLFEDRDFSHGIVLADPNLVATCPLARNDLEGVDQVGGFHH